MKSQFGGITFNAAAFYTDIKDLQVTLDAGSCSSRVVFNVPKAHTEGVEAELTRAAGRGPRPRRSPAAASRPSSTRRVRTARRRCIGGIRDGNRLPTVPKFQSRPAPPTASRSATARTASSAPRSSTSAAASPSRATRRTTRAPSSHGLPFGGAPATRVDDARPEAARLSAGQPQRRRRDATTASTSSSTSTTCSTRTRCCPSTASAAAAPGSASTSASRAPRRHGPQAF